ncbi:MAG: V-type ATP synthase subunit E, partial [Caldicoprobacteraceae bacterium]
NKEAEAGRLKKQLTKENLEAAREHKKRILTVAQLEMRKKVLAAKQEMMDAVFSGTIDRIKNMPDDEYRKVIASALLNLPIEGDEEVVFSVYDEHRLDQKFLDQVNELLSKQGRKGCLRLAPDRGQFRAGFILRTGGIEINNSFEAVIKTLRDEMEPQVADILFGGLSLDT